MFLSANYYNSSSINYLPTIKYAKPKKSSSYKTFQEKEELVLESGCVVVLHAVLGS